MEEKIHEWLINRGINETVLNDSGIIWSEVREQIIIPVFDLSGKRLFNKYRKSPFSKKDSPKYTYDRGAYSMLYNTQKNLTEPIFIVEGELDCLLLNSVGFSAVSSTGGAGTFKQTWADFLKPFKQIYICLDTDRAGLNGAIKIQQKIPHAKWVAIPPRQAKDVTEYVQAVGLKPLLELVAMACSYNIPQDVITIDKKELFETKNNFSAACSQIVTIQTTDQRPHLEMIREFLKLRYQHYAHRYQMLNHTKKENLEEIRRIPITNYLTFNRMGFTNCPWHNDTNASLKYYGAESKKCPNTVRCFGSCQTNYSVIDVVMQLEGCNFKEAVEKLKS